MIDVYRKSTSNIADPLSRLYADDNDPIAVDEDCEVFVRQTAESVAIGVFELENVSTLDSELLGMVASIRTGKWTDLKVADYAVFYNEYSVSEGLILWGTNLVMSSALQRRMLQISHKGHSDTRD